MNILEVANEIVNNRSEEKQRQYGPFSNSMEKAAQIASLLTSKKLSAKDMYLCMIAIKLSREAHNHKEDNLLDLVAYVAALNNYYNEK
jgi:sensor histidine kinase regulating citrate/malate metabolism